MHKTMKQFTIQQRRDNNLNQLFKYCAGTKATITYTFLQRLCDSETQQLCKSKKEGSPKGHSSKQRNDHHSTKVQVQCTIHLNSKSVRVLCNSPQHIMKHQVREDIQQQRQFSSEKRGQPAESLMFATYIYLLKEKNEKKMQECDHPSITASIR